MIVKWWFARVLLLVTFDCAHNSKIAFLMLQIFPKLKQLAVVKETFQIYFMWLRAQGIGMKFQYVSRAFSYHCFLYMLPAWGIAARKINGILLKKYLWLKSMIDQVGQSDTQHSNTDISIFNNNNNNTNSKNSY